MTLAEVREERAGHDNKQPAVCTEQISLPDLRPLILCGEKAVEQGLYCVSVYSENDFTNSGLFPGSLHSCQGNNVNSLMLRLSRTEDMFADLLTLIKGLHSDSAQRREEGNTEERLKERFLFWFTLTLHQLADINLPHKCK